MLFTFRRLASKLTIRQQIGLVFSLGILVLAAIAAIFIAKAAENRIEERLIKQGHSIVNALASAISLSAPTDNQYSSALPILSLPFVGGIAIYNTEGELLFHQGTDIPPPQRHSNLVAVQDDSDHWHFFQEIDKTEGIAAISLEKAALPLTSAGILRSNLMAAMMSAAVMMVLVLLVTGCIVGPLQALSNAMSRARQGESQVRARLTGSKELQAMGEVFNTMMQELEARQEQLCHARDTALASSRIKGEFASTLSHELRTPMNGVMGMLDLLRNTELTEEQQEYVSVAHNSGAQLLRLVDESLQLARSEAGKQVVDNREYAPRSMVEEVAKLLEHKAREQNLSFSWNVDSALPQVLQGDEGKIRQVLINLVGNAIKFTKAGEIHVQASLDAPGDRLLITVADTGPGIPAEAQAQIFEPYRQLCDSEQSRAGTGLGLFICTELVKAMGGDLGVDSKVGTGSRFWFSVPLRMSEKEPAATDLHHHQAAASTTTTNDAPYILVVDDDKSSRMLMAAILKKDGYSVIEAADGTEALAHCRQQAPDLILMDALMPNMDGFTACQEIISLDPHRAPPVLMITGLQDDGTLERAIAAGATDFINKPVNATALRQRVGRMLHVRKVDKHLHQLSNFDQLTGLPNRALFMDQAHQLLLQAAQRNGQAAILFIDLDRFKVINETRGHAVGDVLLQGFGKRLQDTMRPRDLISRLSGDIFTVLLDKVRGPEGAIAAANKILEVAKQPFGTTDQPTYLSASIGIALYPEDSKSITELMRQADAAIYRAKSRGGNTFEFYKPGMELEISREIEVEIDLRDALENDEFVLHYQPQVALPGSQLIGLEALVRWQHPRRGLLQPKDFIPLAEKTGLIARIDEWVMTEACRQLRRWMDAGVTPVPIAVNVSGGELADNLLLSKVKSCLQETQIPAELLKLEITEDTLASSSADTTALLQQLRALGVTLAIDDFGTGYSSLSYLKLFPVDTLKIDRSFINDLPNDSSSAAIVSGIITLGHNLKLTIVAEGAETAEQRHFLEQAKCDVMQGFLVSRPLPAAEIEKWLIEAMQTEEAACAVE